MESILEQTIRKDVSKYLRPNHTQQPLGILYAHQFIRGMEEYLESLTFFTKDMIQSLKTSAIFNAEINIGGFEDTAYEAQAKGKIHMSSAVCDILHDRENFVGGILTESAQKGVVLAYGRLYLLVLEMIENAYRTFDVGPREHLRPTNPRLN